MKLSQKNNLLINILILVIAAITCLGFTGNKGVFVGEYEIKAAFLFNFTKFVTWPDKINESYPRISIGILGNDPFNGHLKKSTSGKTVQNKQLEIHRYQRVQQIDFCHLLYISPTQNEEYVLSKLKNKHILTVGESKNFIKAGGIIRLINKNNKVRFEINYQKAREEKLLISSRLLMLAENLKFDIAQLELHAETE